MGPAAYDLASLLQDARVDVPEQTEVALLGRYVLARRETDAEFRPRRVHQDLRDAGGAARQQDPGYLCPARHARRQAAIFASSSAHMGVSAALARPSGAQAAADLVRRQRAIVKDNLRSDVANRHPSRHRRRPRSETRHGARGRPRHAHAAVQRPIPKPLVKVGNKALIDYVLDRLAAAGVERAVVNVHHMADQIETPSGGPAAAAHRVLRRARANCSAPPAASSRRCRCSATSRSSWSTPTPSGSTA